MAGFGVHFNASTTMGAYGRVPFVPGGGSGGAHGDTIIPFNRVHMTRIATMYERDAVLRAGIAPLVNLLSNATVIIDAADGGVKPTEEMSRYVRDHYSPLIPDILRAIMLFGFVGFRARKQQTGLRVPEVMHENLYTPAIRIVGRKSIDFIAVGEASDTIDPKVFMAGIQQPLLDGDVTSLCSPLLQEFELSQAVRAMSLRMDRLASQYAMMCQKTAPPSKEDTDFSMYADGDRIKLVSAMQYAVNEASVDRFDAHQRAQQTIGAENGIIPPWLFPIPDQYSLANVSHPTTRTDAVALENQRRSHVLAVLGVPEDLVFGGSHNAAAILGAYRIMNGTLTKLQHNIAEILRKVHAFIHPEDPPVEITLEVSGLIATESLELAYGYDMLTPEVFGSMLLEASHIPSHALNPDVKRKNFKLDKLRKETEAASVAPAEDGSAKGDKQKLGSKGSGSGGSGGNGGSSSSSSKHADRGGNDSVAGPSKSDEIKKRKENEVSGKMKQTDKKMKAGGT